MSGGQLQNTINSMGENRNPQNPSWRIPQMPAITQNMNMPQLNPGNMNLNNQLIPRQVNNYQPPNYFSEPFEQRLARIKASIQANEPPPPMATEPVTDGSSGGGFSSGPGPQQYTYTSMYDDRS